MGKFGKFDVFSFLNHCPLLEQHISLGSKITFCWVSKFEQFSASEKPAGGRVVKLLISIVLFFAWCRNFVKFLKKWNNKKLAQAVNLLGVGSSWPLLEIYIATQQQQI